MGIITLCVVVFFIVNVTVSAGEHDGKSKSHHGDHRIVGGTMANIANYPYQAVLEYWNNTQYNLLCGGSLISANHVLTAAHCCVGFQVDLFRVKVGYDGYWNALPSQMSLVQQIYTHEQYYALSNRALVNDIAILKLPQSLMLNSIVRPISLPIYGSKPSSSICTITGFGQLTSNSARSPYLMKADVPLITNSACATAVKSHLSNVDPSIKHTNICTMSNPTRGSCSGDSGGPLAQNGIQIGIVSWGVSPCELNNNPTVYTEVSKYIDWINAKMML